MSTAKNPLKSRIVTLEAGDEFEDFPVETWNTEAQAQPSNLWEEQWEDDDHLDDDFATILKAEVERVGKKEHKN